jgi:hypothetical protein
MSACFLLSRGADVGPRLASILIPAGVATDRPGVDSLLSVELVRSMLTVLRLFLGVVYCDWPFWALDKFGTDGDEVTCCVGVIGRSCDEGARGRFDGTAEATSSSARGRFSGTLGAGVIDAVAFALGVGMEVVSDRRAATLGIGFFFLSCSSSPFVWVLGVLSFASWRSFFSMFVLFGGSRRSCETVGAFAFENFNFTTRLESASSLRFGGSTLADLPFTETDLIRGSA